MHLCTKLIFCLAKLWKIFFIVFNKLTAHFLKTSASLLDLQFYNLSELKCIGYGGMRLAGSKCGLGTSDKRSFYCQPPYCAYAYCNQQPPEHSEAVNPEPHPQVTENPSQSGRMNKEVRRRPWYQPESGLKNDNTDDNFIGRNHIVIMPSAFGTSSGRDTDRHQARLVEEDHTAKTNQQAISSPHQTETEVAEKVR